MRRVRLDRAGVMRPMNPLGSAWAPSVPRWVDTQYVPPAPAPAPAPVAAPAPAPAPAPVYEPPAPAPAPAYVEPAPIPYYAPTPIAAPAPAPVAPAPAGPFCECVADPTNPPALAVLYDQPFPNDSVIPVDDGSGASDGGAGGSVQTTSAPTAENAKPSLPLLLLVAAVLFGS